MKVFTKNFNTATLQTIGTMFLVTSGTSKKMFDNLETAQEFINNIL